MLQSKQTAQFSSEVEERKEERKAPFAMDMMAELKKKMKIEDNKDSDEEEEEDDESSEEEDSDEDDESPARAMSKP